jgi:hypothetical protein
LFIPLVLAVAEAIGCGDDDEDATSQQEYVARSSALCEKTGKKAEVAYKRMVGQVRPTPGEERGFMIRHQHFFREAAIPAIRENVERRAALPAPHGDEDEIDAIIGAGRKAIASFEDITADLPKLEALLRAQIPDPATRFDALSRRYGIDKCGGDQ